MAIKASRDGMRIINNADGTVTAECGLMSDTKAEVVAMGNTAAGVDGLADGTIIATFSTCFTADQELLVLGSDNAWK